MSLIKIAMCVLFGIFISVVVQSLVDNYRTRRQAKDQVLTAKIRRISRQEMKSELDGRDLVSAHILKAELCAYIDSKLAEWGCSECPHEHDGDEDTLTDFCPSCEADMRGGGDDA